MRAIFFLSVLAALLFTAMAVFTSSIKPSIPELQLTFSESGFSEIAQIWSDADLEKFKQHFLIDFPFLLCYGALGYQIATRSRVFSGMATASRKFLALALPMAAMADAVENLFHLAFISGITSPPEYAYFLSGLAASIKWLLIATFIASFLFGYFTHGANAKDRR